MGAPDRPSTQRLAVGALIASGALWGTTWIPIKHFSRAGLDGVSMTCLGYGVVGMVSLPWVLADRRAWRSEQGLFAAAALSGGIANVCFVTALAMGGVVRVVLLFYLSPVWALLGGWLLLNEVVSLRRILGVGAAVLGAGLVVGGGGTLIRPLSRADVLGLASGLFYAAQNVAFRAAERVPVASKTLSVFAGSAVVAGLVMVFGRTGMPELTTSLFTQLVAFAGLWVGAAMWTTMYGVTYLEAGRAGVLLVFELVASLGSAVVIGHERPSPVEMVGATLIVGAAAFEAWAGAEAAR
jgi:drug/metabolite transporter (DMT)-like permease